ncbi:MAG: tetratricopeptide repeat protein, partial [Nannocystaceae bacterium]|nr:tetratricopeptide repeat protein [Nannocystaceae bacterium]
HPVVAKAQAGLGRLASARGRGQEARAHYNEAIDTLQNAVGTRSVQLAPVYQDIARSLVAEKNYADAIVAHERALQLMLDTLGEHPRAARALHEQGRTRLQSGDRAAARQDYERALEIWQKSRGKDHPDLAFGLTQIALLDLEEQQPKRAIERLERALKVRGRKGLKPVLLADTQFALARALSMSGEDQARARELASKAREAYAAAGQEGVDSVKDVDRWMVLATDKNRDRDDGPSADGDTTGTGNGHGKSAHNAPKPKGKGKGKPKPKGKAAKAEPVGDGPLD